MTTNRYLVALVDGGGTVPVRTVLDNPAYADAASRLGHAIQRDAEASTVINELESVAASSRLPRVGGVVDDDVIDLDAVRLGEDPQDTLTIRVQ